MTDEQLRRLEQRVESIDDKLDKVRTEDIPGIRVLVAGEIAALKVKATGWGAIGGLLASIAAVLLVLATR